MNFFADNKNRCPICYRHLKTWPARLGAEFVCMSPHRCTGPNADGSGKRATRNLTGDDRLTCFNCDFDMCRSVTGGRVGWARIYIRIESTLGVHRYSFGQV